MNTSPKYQGGSAPFFVRYLTSEHMSPRTVHLPTHGKHRLGHGCAWYAVVELSVSMRHGELVDEGKGRRRGGSGGLLCFQSRARVRFGVTLRLRGSHAVMVVKNERPQPSLYSFCAPRSFRSKGCLTSDRRTPPSPFGYRRHRPTSALDLTWSGCPYHSTLPSPSLSSRLMDITRPCWNT